jgi:hypothetical protein
MGSILRSLSLDFEMIATTSPSRHGAPNRARGGRGGGKGSSKGNLEPSSSGVEEAKVESISKKIAQILCSSAPPTL